jgi:hypothetical protein
MATEMKGGVVSALERAAWWIYNELGLDFCNRIWEMVRVGFLLLSRIEGERVRENLSARDNDFCVCLWLVVLKRVEKSAIQRL